MGSRQAFLVATVLSSVVVLSACGQKGDLVKPDDNQSAQSQQGEPSSTPTIEPDRFETISDANTSREPNT